MLTFEYEPMPRGFAVPLLMLAVGLTAHGRYFWGGGRGLAGLPDPSAHGVSVLGRLLPAGAVAVASRQ